jgi:alkanesulfonate monooxygenase SsuD/methylene tetrahydromethanopterin reductase-like flavin-dependent oxidoreductase (luciferase family)
VIPILSKQQNEELAKFGSDLRALLERSVIAQERTAEALEKNTRMIADMKADMRKGGRK